MNFDDYQIVGSEFLAGKRFALLADDMGLGKTAQAIRAADLVNAQRILVICPAVARINWKREFHEFSIFDRDFSVCFGASDWPTSNTIVSYDYATDHYTRIVSMPWDLVICDESHFIKEPEAKRTIRIYGKHGIIRATKRLWCLSGTPAPNHAGELWPMLYTFGLTNLGYQQWVEKFCNHRTKFIRGVQKTMIFGTLKSRTPLLKSILNKVMLRRMKSDVLKQLPPLSHSEYLLENIELPITIEFDKQKYLNEKRVVEEAISYTTTPDQAAMVLEGIAESVPTLRRINGLKKAYQAAEVIAQELEDGACDKKILFAWHREVIEYLKERLKKYKPVAIYGGVSPKVRQDAIDSFQKDPETRIFIGQITAAGTAITLTAACYVDMIEEDYVPGNNAQAVMRAHRRGQTRPVFVRWYSIADTISEKITRIHRRKAQELTIIFDSKDESLTTGEQGCN
jgi:SNF2 family DNA or RNA helicase